MDNLHKIIHETPLIIEIIKVTIQSSFSDLTMFCPFYFFLKNSFLSVLFLFIYLYWAVLGLHCCVWAFSGCGNRRLLCCDALVSHIMVASFVVEHRLQ